ncbi:MAG: sulfatase [Phycisphaeraceae bacterium]
MFPNPMMIKQRLIVSFGRGALCHVLIALLTCLAWPALARAADAEAKRPNIVFVLADDLGWMDTTVNGSRYYETPAMERLAGQGMRFTQAYAASPLCSPTRASILTGQYPQRLKLTSAVGHLPPSEQEGKLKPAAAPWSRAGGVHPVRQLELKHVTLAEALKDADYDTIFLGKWHLGKQKRFFPDRQGFDINLGGRGDPGPPGGYFNTSKNHLLPKAPKGTHYDDLLTDLAVDYLAKPKRKSDPFFMCLWYFDVHAPFQGKPELIEKYKAKSDPRGKQDCPTMGAMIETLDTGLGRVLDALKAHGLAEDTIVVFTSDNGGNMYSAVDQTVPTYNFPLRGGKATMWEGGVRVPTLISWPGKIKADSVSDEMISSIDFYPTLLAMAGVEPKAGIPIDGIDLSPLLTGKTQTLERDTLYWHFPHENRVRANYGASSAIRQGDWKLYRYYHGKAPNEHLHRLYNLKDDLGERNDLVEAKPQMVARLGALLDEHLKATDAMVPLPNVKFDPDAEKPYLGLKPKDWGNKRLD